MAPSVSDGATKIFPEGVPVDNTKRLRLWGHSMERGQAIREMVAAPYVWL